MRAAGGRIPAPPPPADRAVRYYVLVEAVSAVRRYVLVGTDNGVRRYGQVEAVSAVLSL